MMKPLPVLLLVFALMATAASAATLTVFAAASLSDALKEAAPLYEKTSGDRLRFNLGGSGTLARQIREGAPADVFFSADELRLDQLENAGLILPGTRRILLANSLVIITASDTAPVTAPAALAQRSVHRVALGDPATVPAGTYARKYLVKLGLWETLKPKTVLLENVRAVLAAVASGNADAGIVYQTDALISKKVKIAFAVPPADGPAITYPAAVVKDTKSPAAARKFVLWLASPEAQKIFARYGFLPPALPSAH